MTAENKVTYGLKDLVIFFESDVESGVENPGIAIPGIITYNRTMNVSNNDMHADDGLYYRLRDEKNGDGTMELAALPDPVVARMLGWRIDSHGGLVHVRDGKPERFHMCYSIQGDKYERRKFVYGCEASVTQDNNETRGESVNFRKEQASITEYGIDRDGEHVWDYVIHKAKHPSDFAASKTSVVYPQPEDAAAADASLSALTIGSLELSPAFDPDVKAYTAATSNATNAVTATPSSESAVVLVTVNGSSVENGSSATWNAGENTVIVVVTDGSATDAYTVQVTKS